MQATYAKPDLLKRALVMGSSRLGLLRLENTGPRFAEQRAAALALHA